MVLTPLLSLRRNDTQRILNGQYMITINLRRRFDASVARQQRAEPYGACLQDDGILFLGASESISALTDKFSMVRCNPGLYYLLKPQ